MGTGLPMAELEVLKARSEGEVAQLQLQLKMAKDKAMLTTPEGLEGMGGMMPPIPRKGALAE